MWENDPVDNDLIDSFTIAMLSLVFDSNRSNPITIEGMNGVGNLTLGLYNLTINPTSYNVEDNLATEGIVFVTS